MEQRQEPELLDQRLEQRQQETQEQRQELELELTLEELEQRQESEFLEEKPEQRQQETLEQRQEPELALEELTLELRLEQIQDLETFWTLWETLWKRKMGYALHPASKGVLGCTLRSVIVPCWKFKAYHLMLHPLVPKEAEP